MKGMLWGSNACNGVGCRSVVRWDRVSELDVGVDETWTAATRWNESYRWGGESILNVFG